MNNHATIALTAFCLAKPQLQYLPGTEQPLPFTTYNQLTMRSLWSQALGRKQSLYAYRDVLKQQFIAELDILLSSCHNTDHIVSQGRVCALRGKTGWIDAVKKQSWSSVFTVKYDIVKLRNYACEVVCKVRL